VAFELHRKFGSSYTPSDSVPAIGLVLLQDGSQVCNRRHSLLQVRICRPDVTWLDFLLTQATLDAHAFLPGGKTASGAQTVSKQVGDKRQRPGQATQVIAEQEDRHHSKEAKES
jgi:hypothetical protein